MDVGFVQVYAACGSSKDGSVRVIQADQTVEVLYESGADYPGISGMWSVPPWPGADFHTLLVLSFASGSRAMATGEPPPAPLPPAVFVHCLVQAAGICLGPVGVPWPRVCHPSLPPPLPS